jgi:hypothetical protein
MNRPAIAGNESDTPEIATLGEIPFQSCFYKAPIIRLDLIMSASVCRYASFGLLRTFDGRGQDESPFGQFSSSASLTPSYAKSSLR